MMKWSRIANGDIGRIAQQRMDANRCPYHNWGEHVGSMYDFLERENAPYNIDLDVAVALHDVIYDSEPNKEARSADFLEELAVERPSLFEHVNIDNATGLIHDTIDHRVGFRSSEESRWIIRADLHQLASGLLAFHNFDKILDESLMLYQCSVSDFCAANQNFIRGLRDRVRGNLASDAKYALFWGDVIRGCGDTIALSKVVGRTPTERTD